MHDVRRSKTGTEPNISWLVVGCELKIPSLWITVRHHSASPVTPNSYPHDRIFNPHLTTIKDSYILYYSCLLVRFSWVVFITTLVYALFTGANRFSYMSCLTLWDKISENLAHLEANKIFQISQNFQTILQHILWRIKLKSHFIVFITSFLHLNI